MERYPLKRCSVCGQEKPLSEFYNRKTSKDGKGYRCKECDNKARKKWQTDNPERARYSSRNRSIKAKYGIDIEQYNQILQAQNYQCAICGCTVQNHSYQKNFNIDHNHETGEVRGLLCTACNRALGLFRDNPDILRKAAEYLDKRGYYDTH